MTGKKLRNALAGILLILVIIWYPAPVLFASDGVALHGFIGAAIGLPTAVTVSHLFNGFRQWLLGENPPQEEDNSAQHDEYFFSSTFNNTDTCPAARPLLIDKKTGIYSEVQQKISEKNTESTHPSVQHQKPYNTVSETGYDEKCLPLNDTYAEYSFKNDQFFYILQKNKSTLSAPNPEVPEIHISSDEQINETTSSFPIENPFKQHMTPRQEISLSFSEPGTKKQSDEIRQLTEAEDKQPFLPKENKDSITTEDPENTHISIHSTRTPDEFHLNGQCSKPSENNTTITTHSNNQPFLLPNIRDDELISTRNSEKKEFATYETKQDEIQFQSNSDRSPEKKNTPEDIQGPDTVSVKIIGHRKPHLSFPETHSGLEPSETVPSATATALNGPRLSTGGFYSKKQNLVRGSSELPENLVKPATKEIPEIAVRTTRDRPAQYRKKQPEHSVSKVSNKKEQFFSMLECIRSSDSIKTNKGSDPQLQKTSSSSETLPTGSIPSHNDAYPQKSIGPRLENGSFYAMPSKTPSTAVDQEQGTEANSIIPTFSGTLSGSVQESDRENIEPPSLPQTNYDPPTKRSIITDSEEPLTNRTGISNATLLAEPDEHAQRAISSGPQLNHTSAQLNMINLSGARRVVNFYRTGQFFNFGTVSLDNLNASEMLAAANHSSHQSVEVKERRDSNALHSFVQVFHGQGRTGSNSLQSLSYKGYGLSTGLFKEVSKEWIAGVTIDSHKNNAQFRQEPASASVESTQVGPFASWSSSHWHYDTALMFGRSRFTTNRRDRYGNNFNSRFGGKHWLLYNALSYEFNLNSIAAGLSLSPTLELLLIRSEQSGHSEQGRSKQRFEVGKFSTTQKIIKLGVESEYLMPDIDKTQTWSYSLGVQQHQQSSGSISFYDYSLEKSGHFRAPSMKESGIYYGIAHVRQHGDNSSVSLNYSGSQSKYSLHHTFQLEYKMKF